MEATDHVSNLNAYLRLFISALLAVGGIGLMVLAPFQGENTQTTFGAGTALLAASGMGFWDTHVTTPLPTGTVTTTTRVANP